MLGNKGNMHLAYQIRACVIIDKYQDARDYSQYIGLAGSTVSFIHTALPPAQLG